MLRLYTTCRGLHGIETPNGLPLIRKVSGLEGSEIVTQFARLRIAARERYRRGVSHCPDSAERKTASITAMFLMPSSTDTGTSLFSRIALEKTSPCSVY